MMNSKYQEALNNLRKFEREHNMLKFGDVVPQPNSDTLQELVDKETPMKPLTNTRFDEESKVYLSISSCKRCTYFVGRFQPYCEECGQKLEWGDDNGTN